MMAKPLSSESPSSAVASDLVKAASACIVPPEKPSSGATQPSQPGTVRREFAIPPELDELLGFQMVPALRRATGLPVNRSTVVRALLAVVDEAWSRSQQRLPAHDVDNKDADQAATELLARLLTGR